MPLTWFEHRVLLQVRHSSVPSYPTCLLRASTVYNGTVGKSMGKVAHTHCMIPGPLRRVVVVFCVRAC